MTNHDRFTKYCERVWGMITYPETAEEIACYQCMTFDFIVLQEHCDTHSLGHGLITRQQELYFRQFHQIAKILDESAGS